MKRKKTILKMVEKFLADRRYSVDGGWTEVEPKDIEQLHELIRALLGAKFELDADRDLPVEFILIDRTRQRPVHFTLLPYEFKVGSILSLTQWIRVANTNVKSAIDTLTSFTRELEMRLKNE